MVYNVKAINPISLTHKTLLDFEEVQARECRQGHFKTGQTAIKIVVVVQLKYFQVCVSSFKTFTCKNLSYFETGDKFEIIVAAVVSGTVFGVLITIGVWILKGKLSKENLW